MKLQEAVARETIRITLGTLILAVIMNIVFLILGQWDITVLLGTLVGCGVAVGNFFLLALTVQKIADKPDTEKRNKLKLQLSYSLRMLALIAIVAVGINIDYFMWVAVILPVFFPRITIAAMQIMGIYKPDYSKVDKSKYIDYSDEDYDDESSDF